FEVGTWKGLSTVGEARVEAVGVDSTSLGRRRSRRDVKRTSEGRTTMSDKHQCRIESDGKSEFVVFNGARIATRDQLDTPQARTWVTLMPGYRRLLRAGFFVIRDTTSKICRTQIGWSPLHQGNVENAYSSIDSSFIAFARRDQLKQPKPPCSLQGRRRKNMRRRCSRRWQNNCLSQAT